MADMYFDVDVALTEVPVNLMPLLDDTDFKTRETAVAYNAAGMDLVWNFATSAGAFTQTAVTPTTAGVYDWVHQGDGIYTIEIPASGGASINNDTEGYGWFTGLVTGVLPWRGPVIGFRAAALNDSLMDTNTTGLAAPATAGRTLNVDTAGAVKIQTTLKVSQALPDFGFTMTDSTNHNPITTSPTVTATRSIDGGAFAACTNSAAELSAGTGSYVIDLSATDMGGASVMLRFTATGCDPLQVQLFLEP